MKTLIINDYRYLRSVLLFWLGLLLLPVLCLVGLHTPLGWSPYYWSSITYAISLLFLAQIITQAVLVSNLVQKENLKNPHAYWLTRPIPRGQLVVAKFISTALWFLLPQFLQIGLMALLNSLGTADAVGDFRPGRHPGCACVVCQSGRRGAEPNLRQSAHGAHHDTRRAHHNRHCRNVFHTNSPAKWAAPNPGRFFFRGESLDRPGGDIEPRRIYTSVFLPSLPAGIRLLPWAGGSLPGPYHRSGRSAPHPRSDNATAG